MEFRWLLLFAAAFSCAAQQPAFEVASVKPTQHGRNAEGLSVSYDPEVRGPGSFSVINNSLQDLITWAYSVKDYQISGPKWLDDDSASFDILARYTPGTPTSQVRVMMQTLLSERFKLALHRETKVFPAYELTAAKGGPKLTPPAPDAKTGINYEGKFWSTLTSESITAAEFASFLSTRLERPVIDRTGIETRFAVNLEYRISDTDTTRPTLFSILQEKMGLTLKPTKAPVELLIIDHIEKSPTAN